MPSLDFVHVDVFSREPFSGNSLAVFPDAEDMTTAEMLRITQELRHFETIFLRPVIGDERRVRAQVFDLVEELPFAGHPLIGAAAVLQHRAAPQDAARWSFELATRTVAVDVCPTQLGYWATLNQGRPEFIETIRDRAVIAQAFGLEENDLDPDLPVEVASTGLAYAVVPLRAGALERARISHDIAALLRRYGAQFAVLVDRKNLEIRHWNNDGIVEDVATGSAAGVVVAWAVKHGLIEQGRSTDLSQGRFTGRPSRLTVCGWASDGAVSQVTVAGDVALVGAGTLFGRPPITTLPALDRPQA